MSLSVVGLALGVAWLFEKWRCWVLWSRPCCFLGRKMIQNVNLSAILKAFTWAEPRTSPWQACFMQGEKTAAATWLGFGIAVQCIASLIDLTSV